MRGRLTGLGLFFLALGLSTASAVPPAAPVIRQVDFSRAGIDSAGNITVGARHSYVVYWEDRSVDEEGFEVQMRGGGVGFFTAARVGAGVTNALITPVTELAAGQVVQFQVIVWKNNGAMIERSTSAAFNFTVPDGTAESTMTGPGNSLSIINLNDSTVRLGWLDRTNSEMYYQIDTWEVQTGVTTPVWRSLGFSNLSSTAPPALTVRDLRLRLTPDKDYQFRVRATRQARVDTTAATAWSNTFQLRTLPLSAPTQLSAQVLQENALRLAWLDNSTNETGYEIQRRATDGGEPVEFTAYATAAEGATSAVFGVPQGRSFEWQVVAQYAYTPTGATSQTTIRSAPSNIVAHTTAFQPPSGLAAATSGRGRTADLTWVDNTGTESGFDIYTRRQGTGTWYFARAVRENVTRVSVNTRTEGTDEDGVPVFQPLEAGVVHEFVVRAVGANEAVFSADSNIATCTVIDGFTSRPYHPAQVGVTFSYTAETTNPQARTSWEVTNLPPGLSFNPETGVISGTPTTAGVYPCVMRARFADAPDASTTLTLRVLPNVTSPLPAPGIIFPNLIVGVRSTVRIPLADKFRDPDAETGVRLETTRGNIDILLYPSLAPRAVENFLSYVRAGDYDNLVFHRLVSGFVLQGGSLRSVALPRTFTSVRQRPAPLNEPGISNTRGTLAAAKVGARTSLVETEDGLAQKDERYGYVGDPDSATTDFFINLAGNSGNLDNQNGGFTVFGRLNNLSLNVVDGIATLPRGSYLNNNTGNSYNPALDKRLIVDGGLNAFSGIPMNVSGEAPADMDINKTIRVLKAYETPPIRYQATSTPSGIVNCVVDGSELRLVGQSRGTANVTVFAIDQDNRSGSVSFQVEVRASYAPPAITRQPAAQAVRQTTRTTFTVGATGTSLTYQWRKNGQNVGTNSSSLVIPSASPADAGEYDVVVSNGSGEVISAKARLDIRSVPTLGTLNASKLVEVGKPLTLEVAAVSGAPAPTLQWRRGTALVPAQSTRTLNIKAAKLTDAGTYTATASNAEGRAGPTNAVKVVVVDKTQRTQVHAQGTRVTLTAAAAGPDIQYRWRKNGEDIPLNRPRHSGMQDPVLVITGVEAGDIGQYDCTITLPEGVATPQTPTTQTGVIRLLAVTRPVVPALAGLNAPAQGFVGVDYSWTLPFSPSDVHTPSRFSLTGSPSLPPGLRFDPATGTLSGRPLRAGTFRLSATATNAAGTSTPAAVGDLVISPLPSANVGVFGGIIFASTELNANRGGRFDITVTDTGAYSARITLGTEVITTAGSLGIGTGISNPAGITYQSQIKFTRRDKRQLTLAFEADSSYGYVNGLLSDGTHTANLTGFRQAWEQTLNPCPYGGSPTAITYNLALDLTPEDVADPDIPQGSGYMAMKVSAKGAATLSGRLADGTAITSSTLLGPAGEAFFFNMLYANQGALMTRLDIGDILLVGSDGNANLRVAGQARWNKSPQAASQRNYQPGFPEVFLNLVGAIYYPPGTNRIVLGLPVVASNAQLRFTQGGISSASRVPDRTLTITSQNTVGYPTANDALTVLTTLNKETGMFAGTFSLRDGTANTTRGVTFQGMIIPGIPYTPEQKNSAGAVIQAEVPASAARGAGYFLLPELLPTVTTSRINSGAVLLRGVPISITTQPLSRTLNPGETLSFSIAATGQGTLTYRWRKNGATIDGATGLSLQLTNITKAGNEGTYDCVVSNGSSTVTSNPAVLTVRAPVTTVTAARSPASTAVATGARVTFTATADGTSPEYQWFKNNTAITGAVESTYVIPSAQVDDSASYTVRAINPANTNGGVTSPAVPLVVRDAIVITSVGRTPADATVAPGTRITFTVAHTGSTEGIEYQWRKANAAIPGATSQEYVIEAVSAADAGGYNVLIKNIVSTSGVLSEGVTLQVGSLGDAQPETPPAD